jgi:thioesterase domain-containing protein
VLPTLGGCGDETVWTIELMAARHVAELRKVQPHGPYRLVGFCVGGKIVLEMARQLRAAGETIERLVMIDSGAGNAALRYMRPILPLITGSNATSRMARQAAVMKRVRWYDARIRWVARQGARQQLGWVSSNVTRRWRKLLTRIGLRSRAPLASAAAQTAAVLDFSEVAGEQVLLRQSYAVNTYIPRRYEGRIDLVWADSAPNIKRYDPTRGWKRVADEVHVHSIVAHHLDLITNKLPEMARVLRGILERAPD